MKTIRLSDIDLLQVGQSIGLAGSIWLDNDGTFYLALLPGVQPDELDHPRALDMDMDDWGKFVRQSDIQETQILGMDSGNLKKIIVRKTARQIDSRVQWRVFKRDLYTCRYCGKDGLPLSVDHIDLWEFGGATIENNLLTACKKCNKLRGNVPYETWITSNKYKELSKNLPEEVKLENLLIVKELPQLRKQRVYHIKSR